MGQPQPIRMAVLGAGRWGPNIIRNFASHQKTEVRMVVDSQEARCKAIRDRYPEVKVTTNADDAFDNSEIDALVISTPTATHYELTKRALNAGKHVFVEKPLATTTAECQELVALAKAKNRTLFVGHIFVYNAGVQAARKYIQSPDFGRVLYIHANRTNLGPIRTDVNALWDLAPHDISILKYWLGESPTAVSAVGSSYLNSKIEDVVFATYNFPNNVMANVHVSWLNPKKVREIVVVGEKKMLVWDDMDLSAPIKIYDKKVSMDQVDEKVVDTFVAFRASIHEGDTVIPKIALNEPLTAECNAFIAAVENPSSSLSTGEDGTAIVEVLEATTASLREQGKRIQIRK